MFQALKTDEFINLFDKIANIPYNYGEILNNSCCDVSKDNKLAIGTKKCLILFNLNVDMNKINMNMNSKFNLNDAFLANVISKPKLNKNLKVFFSKFFNLNELIQKDDEIKKPLKRNLTKNTPKKEPSDEAAIMMEIDDNYIKSNLFDSTIYEFMGSLNSFHSSNSQRTTTDEGNECDESSENKIITGIKYCEWNENNNYNVLAVITSDNQAILFYCDRLGTSKKFDENKIFNVSELWLTTRKYDKLEKVRSADEYIDALYDMIPNCIKWSKKFDNHLDLLFVSFKSNNIAIFCLTYTNSESNKIDLLNDKIKFVTMISIDEENKTGSDDDENLNSFFNINKIIKHKSRISSLQFEKINDCHSILVIGLVNGEILFKILKLKRTKIDVCFTETSLFRMYSFSMPDRSCSKRIEIVKIDDLKYLILIQKEFHVALFLVLISEDYEVNVKETSLTYTANTVQNKLVNFICLKNTNDLSYLLTYENDLYDLISISSEGLDNGVIIVKSLNSFQFELNKSYKCIKNAFLSSNQFLFFQIYDYSLTSLLRKKPVDFYINIYQLKAEKVISNNFESVFQENKPSNIYSDFLWLFRSNMFLNDLNEKFIKKIYEKLNLLSKSNNKEINQKLLRIINAYLVYYYEANNCEITAEDYMNKSPAFYRNNYRDLSISSVKSRFISLIDHVYTIGFEKMIDIEKLMLLIQSDFALRNNFYGKNDREIKIMQWINDNFTNYFELSKHEKGDSITEKLMNSYKKKLNSNENLSNSFKKFLRCNICSKYLRIDKNTEMSYIECEFGHKIKRCVKSLLPLSLKVFKKCYLCEVEWTLYSEDEMPNFLDFFNHVERLCMFCD